MKEGSEYILTKREELDPNAFETRLPEENPICLSGEKVAKQFFANDKLKMSLLQKENIYN